jgi:hypothetical protein
MSFMLLIILPAEVVGQHVLSLLSYKDVARLDSAVLCQTLRDVLQWAFHCTTISNWSKEEDLRSTGAQWCIERGIRVEKLSVKSNILEVVQCLSKHHWLLKGELKLSCSGQAELDAVQCALDQCAQELSVSVSMTLYREKVPNKLCNPALFRARLSRLSWDAEMIPVKHAEQLLSGNPQLQIITVWYPGNAEIPLVASLGLSLRDLTLTWAYALTDEHLAVVAHSCTELQKLSIVSDDVGPMRSLQDGPIAIAENCHELESVHIEGFNVSFMAVTALSAHCSRLIEMRLLTSSMTTESVTSLRVSGAKLLKLSID